MFVLDNSLTECVKCRVGTITEVSSKSFSSGYRYVIRLFATPGLDNENWLSETKLVDEIVLDEDNPPATVLGGRTTEVDGRAVSIVPAESVAGGEMYIELVFE